MRLPVDHRTEGTTLVVTPHGELDIATYVDLRDAVDAVQKDSPDADGLVIDLSATTFMDSSALGLLIGLHRRAAQVGTRFGLVGVTNPTVLRLLDVTKLDEVFEIYTSMDDWGAGTP